MSFFKINTLPGVVWPPLPLPQFGLMWNAYQALEQTQWQPPWLIAELQLKQINSLLKHCYDNVPYYRDILTQIKQFDKPFTSLEEFRKLPILTRSLYQSNISKIKSIKLPPGMEMVPNPIFTSGTNGVPISVYKTNLDNLWWFALSMRDFEWNGMDPGKKLAAIRLIAMSQEEMPQAMSGIMNTSWLPKISGIGMFESESSYGLDIRQDPHQQIKWLKQIEPSYLISLPSNLEILAGILQDSGQTIPTIELIQSIGEPLTKEMREKIEAAFKAPVHNLYSTNEAGYMASHCPEGYGLHVHAENIFTEVLDANNNPCKPGETGRLVFTSLTNFAAPFIRYDILDDVTLADGPCPCGRGLPLWKHVDGRNHPMLFLANGKRKVSTGIMLGIRQIGGVHQFQVIQRGINNFVLNVVPNHEWTREHGYKMVKCIQEEAESSAQVYVRKMPSIGRPNGKLKIIDVQMENESWETNYKKPGATSQLIGIDGNPLFAPAQKI